MNYTRIGHDYTINCFNESDSRISTFTLKAEDPHCYVTSQHTKITLLGAPSRLTTSTRPTPPSRLVAHTSFDYSLVEQLGKTPVQISILDLLRASPQHQKILEQALEESIVPDNMDVAQFQAMVGNLSASQHMTFSPRDIPKEKPNHNDPCLHLFCRCTFCKFSKIENLILVRTIYNFLLSIKPNPSLDILTFLNSQS